MTTWYLAGAIFIVGAGVNFIWEMAHFRLYDCRNHARSAAIRCLVASLGDGILTLLIFGTGVVVFGEQTWAVDPGGAEFAFMVISGAAVGITVELVATRSLRRCAYAPEMPLLPGLRVGLSPVAQMMVLPPITFWIVRTLI